MTALFDAADSSTATSSVRVELQEGPSWGIPSEEFDVDATTTATLANRAIFFAGCLRLNRGALGRNLAIGWIGRHALADGSIARRLAAIISRRNLVSKRGTQMFFFSGNREK